jgi:DNA (cytosine-5)-methyltransferase 1
MESAEAAMGNGSSRPVLRAAGAVLGDLADLGYDAAWTTLAAGDVGAPHRRERVFIVATDTTRNGWDEGRPESARIVGGSDAALGGDSDLELLPTPCAQQSGNTPENHLAKKPGRKVVTDLAILVENGLLETGGALLPTPKAHDGIFGSTARTSGRPIEKATHLQTIVALLPTPRAQEPGTTSDGYGDCLNDATAEISTSWGKYEPAIRRWESLTRPAPAPTEPNKNGNPRLSAAFSEWLMGWPDGWVTDPDIGISRNDQLRIVGNGVCPQQAAAALRYLMAVAS